MKQINTIKRGEQVWLHQQLLLEGFLYGSGFP